MPRLTRFDSVLGLGRYWGNPIHTPARVAHSAHHQTLHLPRDWPWEPGLDELFRQALHEPLPATA